jgi:membrane protein insertase Oxa1/YidC/SpoIIIJ
MVHCVGMEIHSSRDPNNTMMMIITPAMTVFMFFR